MALVTMLVLTLISHCWSAPHRRNWTPQAILYLKGAQGHRSILERSSRDEGETLQVVTLNHDSDPQAGTSSAASSFLDLLQQIMDEGGHDPYEELNYF
ncbi:spexin-like [Sphaeramia orbicularis]|uniref:spexin-like n=1 Tax=Sphaeramia orbicularis TaxID=375764 RepID=UPI0011802E85|nr:spexin-like [Sphaeramia orbicularis]XP_029992919.1 spexin-like [Sphaeramia orbicularis]XP_029992920.1 spexin-like [Sphaeramia orbicularis]XP_029992921.1 spexin-like [Sphaeramia orbicularis]XP_029992922.1 spexin-like [Sphaeramia orbicularis]XP_029992923.1 spexin-like [Sphaeramia orbicularis]